MEGRAWLGGQVVGLKECRVATHSALPPQQVRGEGDAQGAAC